MYSEERDVTFLQLDSIIMYTMHSCNFGVAGVDTIEYTHPYIYFYVYSANAGPVTLVEIVEKKLTNV